MDRPRLLTWLLRVLWAVLPFTAGPAIAAALDGRDPSVRTAASVVLWAGWAVALCALLVPHPAALTAIRVAAPTAVAASMAAAVAGHSPLGLVLSTAAAGLAFTPAVSMLFVNGPAYPNERRFPLRPPAPLLLGPLELAWAVVVGAPLAGVLLLAGRRWVVGAVVLAIGLPASWLLLRSLYGLARRWLVFVPAGVVVHDPLTLADPVLFRRETIASLAPAEVGTDAVDLTLRAPGLALELTLHDEAKLLLTRPGRRPGETVSARRILVTPTRPGAVLAEASARRLVSRRR